MTFPVFASGDVLNASDMNAVGMWLVKSQTIGTGVSSVNVTNAFSADYDNYLITIAGGVASGNVGLNLQIGAATTGYYEGIIYSGYSTTTVTTANRNNQANFGFGGGSTNVLTGAGIIGNPFLTKNTVFYGFAYPETNTSGNAILSLTGFLNNSTSYTDFTIATSSGTMTGGAIRVYGLRN